MTDATTSLGAWAVRWSRIVVGLLVVVGFAVAAPLATEDAHAAVVVTPVAGTPAQGTTVAGIDNARLDYELSEFFVAGQADSYHNVGALTNTAPWVVAPDGAPQPFKTRIQVLEPADGTRFNGTVFVEWFNVTGLRDSSPDWNRGYVEFWRQGAVYVGISAQAAGVNQLVASDPGRYGTLTHPGDSYSYDIYTQVSQALLDHSATILGPEFTPERMIAIGHSQSGSRLVTYVNAFGSSAPFDAYAPRGSGANPAAALRQAPLGAIPVPSPTLITNFDKPVIRYQSETESLVARQPDSTNFRWWEVPGSSHVDAYGLAGYYPDSPAGAALMFDQMLVPFSGPIGSSGFCQFGINAGPGAWVNHAAFRHLNEWVTNGVPAPSAPRITTVDGTPTGAIVRDEHGNALGGVRTPYVDVPVATLLGSGNAPVSGTVNFCALFGRTLPFDSAKLAALYPNHGSFVSQWSQSTDQAVAAGFVTPEDGEHIKDAGAMSSVGKKK